MLLSAKLEELTRASGKTKVQAAIARRFNIDPTYVNQLFKGRRGTMSSDIASRICCFFEVGYHELRPFTTDWQSTLPLLGTVSAGGYASYDDIRPGELLEFGPRFGLDCVALRVSGNSVTGFGVHDGDTVVIRLTNEPEEDKLIVAKSEGGYTLKGYKEGHLIHYDTVSTSGGKPKILPFTEDTDIVGVLIETMGQRDCSRMLTSEIRDDEGTGKTKSKLHKPTGGKGEKKEK